MQEKWDKKTHTEKLYNERLKEEKKRMKSA